MKTGLFVWVITASLAPNYLAESVAGSQNSVPYPIYTDGASAPHGSQGAAIVNPVSQVSGVEKSFMTQNQKCFTFTSDDPNWHYGNSAPWAGSGTFGNGQKQICVDRNDKAGGAMFIAPGPDTPPGSTKLECYFPTSGTANYDVSLVDGYSLSVTCNTAQKNIMTIGGSLNLWRTGENCLDQSQIAQGICKNDQGYAANENDVTPFFQSAIQNGNNYCIWVNCGQDYFFDVEEDIQCHVSGGQ